MYFTMASGEAVDVPVSQLIIAGWSGRDPAAIEEHIEELRALGVTPPSQTPLFYRLSADRLTTATAIEVLGSGTSGEAEVVLVGSAQGTLVGIGSDHTDRDAETWSVVHSKQLCPKPVADTLWRLSDVLAHWDSLRLEASAVIAGERVSYQAGTIDGLLPPAVLLEKLGHGNSELQPGHVMFCGTLPVIGGIRPATRFEAALVDPVLGRRIEHAYDIHELPVVN